MRSARRVACCAPLGKLPFLIYDTTPTSSRITELPPSVLLKIFELTKQRGPFDFAVNYALPELALVCKSWLAVARTALYTEVYLGANLDDFVLSVEEFLETVSSSPSLAARVHGITYGSHYMRRTELLNLALIIECCSTLNLRRLKIWGWNGYELEELRAAMKKAVKLQSLELCRRSLTDMECDRFATIPQFFVMLHCWPQLQSLSLWQEVLMWDSLEDKDDPSLPAGFDRKKDVSFPVTAGASRTSKSSTMSEIFRKGTCSHSRASRLTFRLSLYPSASSSGPRTLLRLVCGNLPSRASSSRGTTRLVRRTRPSSSKKLWRD
ncbi:hypothetical protein BV25DRAFT_1829914 [Artomyces pyxidatus]|uniref:Uncharacterized protein n=1 Tax=Artomyces pyxidatus TaxID=48021 RepID=A0ACB8SS44_9AGAM|nr:hypothetical protein BV25DRAFT_1829914 [Artomyces pyxidatus]